ICTILFDLPLISPFLFFLTTSFCDWRPQLQVGGKKKGGLGACIQPCCCPFFAPANRWISLSLGLSQRPCSCPPSWIGFEGKCFYFSDGEKNQTLSQADCHARGANLAVIQSKKELDFMMRYKGSHDHWIGLSRQNPRQRWEWDDGTEFDSSLFPIGGGEDFAFLNNQRVTSVFCLLLRSSLASAKRSCISNSSALHFCLVFISA
uniref:C-type lectin domain-containing protein n=1 Tax=Anas platyrhynchos TaxID=8839 RepID=A0A8B9SH52_ANAPL